MTRVWFLALLWAIACVEPSVPHAPEPWIHLRSDHFELSTDLSEPDARQAVEALEKNRAAVLAAGWSGIDDRASARVNVVLLRDKTEFRRYFGSQIGGLFSQRGTPTLFLWGAAQHWGRGGEAVSTLRHELVHRVESSIYARRPRWFSEGLAQFLEALEISEDWSHVARGYFNPKALAEYRRNRHVHVRDALAWRSYEGLDQSTMAGLYGISWLLVHWLYNVHPDEFAQYQVLLAQGTEPDAAWKSAFAKIPIDGIDDELERHSRYSAFQITEVKLETKPFTVTARPMTVADARGITARLWIAGSGLPGVDAHAAEQAAREEIDQALALESGNHLALTSARLLGRRFTPSEWSQRVRAQVTARPDDGEAWGAFADDLATNNGSEEEIANTYRRAMTLLPNASRAYNNYAWYLLQHGNATAALPLAIKASLYDSSSASVLDTLAAVYFALDRCRDALGVQRRAIDRIGEDRASEAELKKDLAKYETTCGP